MTVRVLTIGVLVACAAAAQAQTPTGGESAPAGWRASEHQFVDARKRDQVGDYAGARAAYEAAWKTLQAHKGWSADWGSLVSWELGMAIAYTCSDYERAREQIEMAVALNSTGNPIDMVRQARMLRDLARVDHQAGRFARAAQGFDNVLPLLEPSLNRRSPLLLADLLDEAAAAQESAGHSAQAGALAARAKAIRSAVPANPLMARAAPTLAQVCGAPAHR